MDVRRFYVVSQRDQRGPFTVEELIEELDAGRITATQQVRTGFGTMLGSVRDVIDTPQAMWNTAESGSALSSVDIAQRRNRILSLVILGLTLIPALTLIAFLGSGTTAVSASTPSTSLPPPPHSQTVAPLPDPVRPTVQRPAETSTPTPTPTPTTTASTSPVPKPPVVTSVPEPHPVAVSENVIVRQSTDGIVRLTASSATITAKGARLQAKGTANAHIGSWNDGEGGVEWEAMIDRPGSYEVTITYACNRSGAGVGMNISAGDQAISDLTVDTGSWDVFKPHRLSQPITISKAGSIKVFLAPINKRASAFMKLSGIRLTPIPATR
jgi:hypothetical protein